ncbi:MAG: Acyl-CoA dehydrogenase, Mycobacterial subgroup FadE12 in terpen utilization operon [uncultured Corynebacteriales bacterium]|uniref:Acyl-CoA dehydrogenase, Mycobacterial subgroup FadE12 in terpen utilization operon n=1 Tax=uncultured Mycobacteriales bacterium TaxID=581187 RepID=A0A6J4JCC3_9ACTN|nr:MAG: Acyl-CoA dehydrogenase, Mycobacterial subgroup FadE12 in terpen utilization operon [uncultured Corynebacteriales bacterium]
MDFAESPEQQLLRKSVADVAARYGHPYWLGKARAGEKTHELWDEVGRLGYLGVGVPEEYGGGGHGIAELAIVTEELAAAGCPLLLIVVSPAICATIIARSGTAEQKERWLPGLAAGSIRMAFAITEPDAGSNSHKLSTVATRDGDDWLLTGRKTYISGVDEAHAVLVVARAHDARTGTLRPALAIVPTDAPGLERTPIPVEITGPEKQFALFLDDVRVPADAMVGQSADAALAALFAGLNPERITGAAVATGIGRYALAKAAAYANTRQVWGVPIGSHQGLAHPLANAAIQVELARLMTAKAGWLYDTGQDAAAGEAANMAKYAAAEAALLALDQAIQTHGGNGLATEYGLATLWGAARLARTAPISREMILNFVATHTLGLPRSY